MDIPGRIKVGAKTFGVLRTNSPLILNNQACGGIIDTEECTISLDTNRSIQSMESHFLHECLHAICRDRGLDELDENETTIDSLARGLHAFIVDNPDMFK